MAEGTVFTSVTSDAAGNDGSASGFSAKITLAPQLSGTNSSNMERSKQIDVAARTPRNSDP